MQYIVGIEHKRRSRLLSKRANPVIQMDTMTLILKETSLLVATTCYNAHTISNFFTLMLAVLYFGNLFIIGVFKFVDLVHCYMSMHNYNDWQF